MKKIKLSLSILMLLPLASCEIEGINSDTPVEIAGEPTPGKLFDISTDNSGVVRITPTGTGLSRSVVEFGHGTGVAATANVSAGQSVTHTYPEGKYTVTIKTYDLAGRETITAYPLEVKFVAPKNLKIDVATAGLSVTVTPTADYAKGGYRIDFGDGTAVTTIAEGKNATHTYAKAGDYKITVTALSGGAATATADTTVKVTKPFSLPVTFDDPDVSYGIGGVFGGVDAPVVANPFISTANPSAQVWKFVKNAGAESWAGTWTPLAAPGGTPINIDNGSKFTMLVYATETGRMLHFQLESGSNGVANQGIDIPITVANQWQLLTFDFSALNIPAGTTFSQYVVQYNLAEKGKGEVVYIDNITQIK